ncbi:hypothetical protein ASD54_14415 [Rhizobium sp. Root149]|nr:hypothetical protein ASD54_14415 [Rhizobium sp. Root149]
MWQKDCIIDATGCTEDMGNGRGSGSPPQPATNMATNSLTMLSPHRLASTELSSAGREDHLMRQAASTENYAVRL